MMEQNPEWREVAGTLVSIGTKLVGVRVQVSGISDTLRNSPAVGEIAHRAAQEILDELTAQTAEADPEFITTREQERAALIGMFQAPIHVRDIPNQYSSRPLFRTRPWFRITTQRGPIIVGRRKSVIVIDWSDSDVGQTADELFPTENVTKVDRLIHAHSLEDAIRYADRIIRTPI